MHRVFCLLAVAALAAPAWAVRPSYWTHSREADFKTGTMEHVVATSLGDVKLSRAVQMVIEEDARISSVYALAEGPDGTIYAGTGPQGVILRIAGDEVETLATLDYGTSIFSLLIDEGGRLLVGTGGEQGQIFRIDKPDAQPQSIFASEDVQYIWAMQRTADGAIYAATGPNGQLYEIRPDGGHRVLLETNENNIMSLVSDGRDLLFAGTDPNGLVYRINRRTGDVFVLYDAPESEISALALDARGNLYAATAQAGEQLRLGPGLIGPPGQIGRPPAGDGGVPIPADPPTDPAPPETPEPFPGDPEPIPNMSLQVNPAPPAAANDADPADPGEDAPPDVDGEEPPPDAPDVPDAEDDPQALMPPFAFDPGRQPAGTPGAAEERPEGNAIYRINREGFVTEIFRQPVMVLSMLEQDGVLLVGAGAEEGGLIYQVDPAAEETLVVAQLHPRQVMSLLPAGDGRIIIGMANAGALGMMSPGFAAEGTYTSPVLDATQISRFGNLQLRGSLPAGTALAVATRSGNVRDPDETGWSAWSEESPASRFIPIASPPARFLQYRLRFTSEDGRRTAVVEEVEVAYQPPNLPPQVRSVRIGANIPQEVREVPPVGRFHRSPVRVIVWEASDPNRDPLEYSLYFRYGGRGPWILLAEELAEPQYEWDTRSVADGQYEVKVVASDQKGHPPGAGRTASRVSNPFIIDNTPPVIGDLSWRVQGNRQVRIECRVVDRTSTVTAVHYSVNSSTHWHAVAASDKMYDSPEERVVFTIGGLAPGPHQVTIRATDARGNQAFENILVTME